METPFLGLRTVIYMVSDLEKAKEWYGKAFNADPYYDTPYYVGFNIGGYELGLHPAAANIPKGANAVTYWGVDNIESEYQRLLELGAIEYEKPNNVGGDIVVAAVKDAWENVVGLIYNPDFKVEENS